MEIRGPVTLVKILVVQGLGCPAIPSRLKDKLLYLATFITKKKILALYKRRKVAQCEDLYGAGFLVGGYL